MRTHTHALIVVCALLVAMPVSVARADIASDMRSELQAAGVPSISVSVAAPSAATTTDANAWQTDAGATYASVSPLNLLSPQPTFPLPVATMTFGPSTATMWPGFIRPPGVPGWEAVEDALVPVWRLSIMEALKHRLAAGAQLAGVAMQPNLPNGSSPGAPDLYLTPPDAADFPSGPLPQTMPVSAVETSIKQNLPPTYAAATVSVANGPGGQRSVNVSHQMPPQDLALAPASIIVGYLMTQQQQLNQQGANIGPVVFRLTDPTTNLPVFTYAGDASWGQSFSWAAPLARAYVVSRRPGLSGGAVDDVGATVGNTLAPPTE